MRSHKSIRFSGEAAHEDEQYDEDPEEHSLRLVTEEIERSFANKKPSTPLQRKAAKVIADLLYL